MYGDGYIETTDGHPTYCVVCGALYDENHHCDPVKEKRLEAWHRPRNEIEEKKERTFGDRIQELNNLMFTDNDHGDGCIT
jgi:hypothetical protein